MAAFASQGSASKAAGIAQSDPVGSELPNLLAIVALFSINKQIGDVFASLGLNTHAGLIMVYLGGAMGMNIWLMKGYMDTIRGILTNPLMWMARMTGKSSRS